MAFNVGGAFSGAASGASAGSSFGPWGAAIGGVAGGLLGGFGGSDSGSDTDDRIFANQQLQREFAQNGIRWRVADAKAAGIHPLFALGAQLPSASPVQVFEESRGGALDLSNMGQDITRAIDSTRTADERAEARRLSLENASLQNDLLRAQISKIQADQVGPPLADPSNPGVRLFGTSDAPIVEQPMQRVVGNPSAPWQEPGAITDAGFGRTATGYAVMPSKDAKERIEDDFFGEITHAIRNRLLPAISERAETFNAPPVAWLPIGSIDWRFDPFRQEYYPIDRDGNRIWRF